MKKQISKMSAANRKLLIGIADILSFVIAFGLALWLRLEISCGICGILCGRYCDHADCLYGMEIIPKHMDICRYFGDYQNISCITSYSTADHCSDIGDGTENAHFILLYGLDFIFLFYCIYPGRLSIAPKTQSGGRS